MFFAKLIREVMQDKIASKEDNKKYQIQASILLVL